MLRSSRSVSCNTVLMTDEGGLVVLQERREERYGERCPSVDIESVVLAALGVLDTVYLGT
jgi:hypothetical protein